MYKLKKSYAAGFRLAGIKPSGSVAVDWGSSILAGDDPLVITNTVQGPRSYRRAGSDQLEVVGTPREVYTTHGQGFSGDGATTTAASHYAAPRDLITNGSFTYYAVYIPENITDSGRGILSANASAASTLLSGTIRVGFGQNNSDIEFYHRRAVRYTASGVLAPGVPIVIAQTGDGGLSSGYINGQLVSTFSNVYTDANRIMLCGGNLGSGNGSLMLGLCFNESHSEAEIEVISARLASDPYQILKPATARLSPLGVVEGGGGEYLSALSPDLDIFAGVTLGLSAGSITILAPDTDDSQAQILALSSGLSAAITAYQDTFAQQGMLIATGYSAASSPLLGLSEGQALILASGYTALLATDDDAVAYPATVLVTGAGEPSYIAVMLPLEQTSQAQALSASLGYRAQQAELSGTSAVITINLSGGGSFGLSPDSYVVGFSALGITSGAIFTISPDLDAASYPATTILTGVVIGPFTSSGVIDVSPVYGVIDVTQTYGIIAS